MAKTKTKQTPTVDVLTLKYQLAELPSSQHRAGLAGLVLVVRWLQRQPEFKKKIELGAVCKLTQLDDSGATLELNQVGLEFLFDEIYAASIEEKKESKLRTKNGEIITPLREEEEGEIDFKTKQPKVDKKTGAIKKRRVYFYPATIPKGSFLADPSYDKSSDGRNGFWIKLWRDTLWSILKSKDRSRTPFYARARGEYQKDAVDVWKALTTASEKPTKLAGSFFLGVREKNAESAEFKDIERFHFLLRFWLYSATIYIPQKTKFEKNKEDKRFFEKSEFFGYAIAVPDVTSLKLFCEEFPQILKDRGIESFRSRPRDAIVDLAIESALDTMKRLKDRLVILEGEKPTQDLVAGFDVFHAIPGEDVKFRGITRIKPDFEMVDEYAKIRHNYSSPLFRKQCLLNLVNHQPWYTGFDALLCTLPYEQSIENDFFRRDVRKKLEDLIEEEKQMSETSTETAIEPMIFQLVKNYVGRKLKSKYSLEWKPEWKSLKSEELNVRPDYREYAEKKAKVAKSAFLDIRSRTEQTDFINYFSYSLCSVPQHMKPDDFVILAQALYQHTDKVRTLTLLALSANS
ncbi:type I-MYXAN CRISPR-associated protein Cmx8 [Microcoleus sp. FACHB-1515]|uniref:type I-MYXAN CRISPR-associated protein Cmx8 n=1 Tax=Cyanophyceae TaxID=3028117 RepID=UPI001686026E|nr:type I-MYXAN CRISPR-associated protein Cmx8 [Microcoleus sp. FACHB-1515]MBD2093516.1 type I-MYXAN CRISPR-associated protein Cmx8 [Microcoleus sp. FACHB-1515]